MFQWGLRTRGELRDHDQSESLHSGQE